jgi:hypothetical protein
MTKSEKIARAIKYTAFARKNPNDAADVNFYLNAGEKVTQQQLDDYHAAAAGVAVAEPEPAVVEARAFNAHRERQRAPLVPPTPEPEPESSSLSRGYP